MSLNVRLLTDLFEVVPHVVAVEVGPAAVGRRGRGRRRRRLLLQPPRLSQRWWTAAHQVGRPQRLVHAAAGVVHHGLPRGRVLGRLHVPVGVLVAPAAEHAAQVLGRGRGRLPVHVSHQ